MMLFQLSIGESITIGGSTLWEQLTCVGYNPDTSKLEAVVAIKLARGIDAPGAKVMSSKMKLAAVGMRLAVLAMALTGISSLGGCYGHDRRGAGRP